MAAGQAQEEWERARELRTRAGQARGFYPWTGGAAPAEQLSLGEYVELLETLAADLRAYWLAQPPAPEPDLADRLEAEAAEPTLMDWLDKEQAELERVAEVLDRPVDGWEEDVHRRESDAAFKALAEELGLAG